MGLQAEPQPRGPGAVVRAEATATGTQFMSVGDGDVSDLRIIRNVSESDNLSIATF